MGAPVPADDLPSSIVPQDDLPDALPTGAVATPETAGRVAGLAGRAVATGAAALPDTVIKLASPLETGLEAGSRIGHAIRQKLGWDPPDAPAPAQPVYSPQLSDFVHPEKWQQAAEYFADKAGLPSPQTAAERIGYRAAQAVPSAALAPEALGTAAISAGLGGAASQAAAEEGVGPAGQAIVGLAAGSLPAVAGNAGALTRAITGGDSAATVAARNAAAADAGTTLTAGQASGSKPLQKLESASGLLWGGGAIDAKKAAQAADVQSRVDGIVSNLSPNAAPSPTTAGEAINAGGAAAKANLRAAESAAYADVDAKVPAATPVTPTKTVETLNSIAGTQPGAEKITALQNSQMQALRDQVNEQLAANGGTLPYSAVVDLRSKVGALTSSADGSVRGPAKQLYQALSADRDAAASAVSPDAAQAVTKANSLYKANLEQHEFLDSVIDKAGGPESVYQAATNGTKLGATKVGGVMSVLSPEQQNIVRATVLDRLGRAVPSAQGASGSAFDASTFLTNWNKLAPEAKDALFNGAAAPKTLRTSLDSLADTIETLKNSQALKNPGGTAKAGEHSLGLFAVLEGGVHAMTFGKTLLGNAILSRVLTNPRTAAWLAQTAKLPASALPNAVNQLAKLGQANNDQDAKDLAAILQQAK